MFISWINGVCRRMRAPDDNADAIKAEALQAAEATATALAVLNERLQVCAVVERNASGVWTYTDRFVDQWLAV